VIKIRCILFLFSVILVQGIVKEQGILHKLNNFNILSDYLKKNYLRILKN